ncbi:MAG TPA: hypothetical protein VGC97_19595 [Pyrinomonadaceae bacterium]
MVYVIYFASITSPLSIGHLLIRVILEPEIRLKLLKYAGRTSAVAGFAPVCSW